MNEVDYSTAGAEGSTRDYFLEMSYEKFDVQTDVVGIYTAKNNLSYYGADSYIDNDTYASELMKEAVASADADIDFTKYDNDGDGEVDGVYIIYAGYGQASSGIDNTIWPHAGGISGLTFDGMKVSRYSCSNELNYNETTEGLPDETNKELTTIGVICHEFGHVCGAPDYYDTDYETSGLFSGTGRWDLMDKGLYNGSKSGSQPAHFNPFEKIRAGWIQPILLTQPTTLTLPDVTSNPVVYMFPTKTDGEFYYLENRQQQGFNTYCPGHGLLIYHYSKKYWDLHANKSAPQGFYPVCASSIESPTLTSEKASYGSINAAGCPFPGSSSVFSFTDETIPTARSWDGVLTERPLTSIVEMNGVIILTFLSKPTVDPVLVFSANGINASQAALAWKPNNANNSIVLAVNTVPTFGTLVDGTAYQAGDPLPGGGTIIYNGPQSAFTHSNLDVSTTYYYQLWSVNNTRSYSTTIGANASTTSLSVTNFPFVEGFEGVSFPLGWNQTYLNDTLDWQLKTKGVNSHPASAHGGSKILRINDLSWGDYVTKLVTPPLNLEDATQPTLTFWHTQAVWNGNQDKLKVFYRTSVVAEWKLLAAYSQSITEWTLETLSLPEPSPTYYIAFEGITGVGYGVCLDDIEVSKSISTGINTINQQNQFGKSLFIETDKQGKVTVNLPQSRDPYTIRVYTLTGQLVSVHQDVTSSLVIDKLVSGVYLINAQNTRVSTTQKCVVQ